MQSPNHHHLAPSDQLILPQFLEPWVLSQKCLTAQLKALTGAAELKVLRQDWVVICQRTDNHLKLNSEPFWQREIIISSSQKPCWYARTIIPERIFYTHETLFARLKQESLGDIIYNNPRIQRLPIRHYPITSQCAEYDWLRPYVQDQSSPLWVRLAQLIIDEQDSFFLYEIFLSGLESL